VALHHRLAKAKSLGKPVVLGEFGLTLDHPLAQQEALYATIMDAAIAEGVDGIMPYAWGPLGPNGWGADGGHDLYTDHAAMCALVRSRADEMSNP
jgi:hypothetical protein